MVLLRYCDLSTEIQNGQRCRFILQSAYMKMLGHWDTPSLSAQDQESHLCHLLPSTPCPANSSPLNRRERCALQYVALGTCVSGPAPASWFRTLTVCTLPSAPSLRKLLHPSWCPNTGFHEPLRVRPRTSVMVTTHTSLLLSTRGTCWGLLQVQKLGTSHFCTFCKGFGNHLWMLSLFLLFFFTPRNSSRTHAGHPASLLLLPPTLTSASGSPFGVSGWCFLSLIHLSLQLCLICFSAHKLCFKPQALCFSFSKRFIKSTYKFIYLPFIISYFFKGNFSTLL